MSVSESKSDPLLSALIDTLPPVNKNWPVDRQMSWLHLMAIAFGAVYGGDAAARLTGQLSVAFVEPLPLVAALPPRPPEPKLEH